MSTTVTLNNQNTTSLIGAAIIGGFLGTANGIPAAQNPYTQPTYPVLTSYELQLPSHSFTSSNLGFTPKEKVAILRTAQERIKSTQVSLDPEIEKLLNDNLFDLI